VSLIDRLSAFFSRPDAGGDVPEGVCPNCWGQQEYDGQIRQVIRDRQVDVSNDEARHAFIKDFVVTHIDGITLKNNACPACGSVPGGHHPRR